MDLSHNSASPRVEFVTWSSFWVLVKRNPGTYRCSAAPCDISVTQDDGPTFILIQPLSAGKTFRPETFSGAQRDGRQMFSARHIFTVATFSVSIRTVWFVSGGARPPERREQASPGLFQHKETVFLKPGASAHWRRGNKNNQVSVWARWTWLLLCVKTSPRETDRQTRPDCGWCCQLVWMLLKIKATHTHK